MITNYAELQTAIADWMARSDVNGKATEFIALAEARLNRVLGPVATTAMLSTVAGSNIIDLSAIAMVKPTALFMTPIEREISITPKALGTFPEMTSEAVPAVWTIEGGNIRFDCPANGVYPVRFVYEGRFALSDAAPTNEFLTKYPDAYLAASILWGAVWVKDGNSASGWKGILEEALAEAKSDQAQSKRGVLTPDPMFSSRRFYDSNSDYPL